MVIGYGFIIVSHYRLDYYTLRGILYPMSPKSLEKKKN